MIILIFGLMISSSYKATAWLVYIVQIYDTLSILKLESPSVDFVKTHEKEQPVQHHIIILLCPYGSQSWVLNNYNNN